MTLVYSRIFHHIEPTKTAKYVGVPFLQNQHPFSFGCAFQPNTHTHTQILGFLLVSLQNRPKSKKRAGLDGFLPSTLAVDWWFPEKSCPFWRSKKGNGRNLRSNLTPGPWAGPGVWPPWRRPRPRRRSPASGSMPRSMCAEREFRWVSEGEALVLRRVSFFGTL